MEEQDKIQGKRSKFSTWFRVMVFLIVMWACYITFMYQPKNELCLLLPLLAFPAGLLLPDHTYPQSLKTRRRVPFFGWFDVPIFLCFGILLLGAVSPFSWVPFASFPSWWQGFIGGLLLWATTSLVNRTRKFQNTQHQKGNQLQESLAEEQKDQSKMIFPSPEG